MKVKRIILVVLNITGLLFTLVINSLANILPINGKTTGAISDHYPNLFVPAGLTFSIWFVIYVLLIAFVAYQVIVLVRKKDEARSVIEKTGAFFFVSCLANSGWIFAWHYGLVGFSIIVMLVLLAALITLYLRLGVGKAEAPAGERYTVHAAISVYLGWISIATIANASAFLVYLKWDGFGIPDQVWTAAVIAAGIALGIATLLLRKDVFYPIVVAWALIGILIKRFAVDPAAVPAVIATAIAGLSVIAASIVIQSIRREIY